MTTYRFIGTGETDASGVARLTKDPQGQTISGYTGSGVGEVDFVASLDNPIESGSIVSVPYSVLDATFKDIGTSTNYGTWTSTDFTGTKIERNSEYTTLIPEDTWDTQNKSISDTDLCIEFDCNLTFSDAIENHFLRFYKSNASVTSITPLRLGLVSGQWSHIKLVRNGTTVNITVDGTSKTPLTGATSIDEFRVIMSNAKITNMKYKNFMIYPV